MAEGKLADEFRLQKKRNEYERINDRAFFTR